MCLAIPGKVLTVHGADPLAKAGEVSFGGVVREVSFAFQPGVEPGDYVLVHVGVAIARVDEEEALRTLEAVRRLGELDALEGAAR